MRPTESFQHAAPRRNNQDMKQYLDAEYWRTGARSDLLMAVLPSWCSSSILVSSPLPTKLRCVSSLLRVAAGLRFRMQLGQIGLAQSLTHATHRNLTHDLENPQADPWMRDWLTWMRGSSFLNQEALARCWSVVVQEQVTGLPLQSTDCVITNKKTNQQHKRMSATNTWSYFGYFLWPKATTDCH
jgi:hypothetical protein